MEIDKSEWEDLDDLADKVLKGIAEASRKLVEESAALGRSLVISEGGEVKIVPAKDLLSKVTSGGSNL